MALNINVKMIIYGAISIIIGLILLPVMADFKKNAGVLPGNHSVENTNVTGVSGLTTLMDLVLYGFTFGLVALGVGLIYMGFKGKGLK